MTRKQTIAVIVAAVLTGVLLAAWLSQPVAHVRISHRHAPPPPAEELRESADAPPEGERSGKWPTVRKYYLEDHPVCEACGSDEGLNVHHVIPFHERPDLELEQSNLITLCSRFEDSDGDGENDVFNCHFLIGHDPDGPWGPKSPNWKVSNSNVWRDAARYRESLKGELWLAP